MKHSWAESLATYRHPKVLGMLFFGFSAGLPFLLVFSTLTAWFASAGVSRSAIGFLSWIGITYSIKFLWAPFVDRVPLPLLTAWLGKRRSWLLAAQLTIALGLFAMSGMTPADQFTQIALIALVVAFGSATQDVALDAYRIEAVERDRQAAMAATYMLGYRLAILAAGAGAFYIADFTSWELAYRTMAALMMIGVVTTLISSEPIHAVTRDTYKSEERVQRFLLRNPDMNPTLRRAGAFFTGAIVAPLVDFFSRFGVLSIFILLLVATYKISDISMAAMANPFYLDLGFTLSEIATVTKVFGVVATIVGSFVGGLTVARFGLMRNLLTGAIMVGVTNLAFAWLSTVGAELPALFVTIALDNFSNGFAATVFIAYMSSLTNSAYTATQYALFSSLMTLPAKFIGGFSGVMVDTQGYFVFFLYVGALGLPAVAVILYLMHRGHDPSPEGVKEKAEPGPEEAALAGEGRPAQ